MKTLALPTSAWRRWGLTAAMLAGLAAILSACYPGTVDDITELDLVVTDYDTEFDFQAIHYYAMPDQVVDIAATIADDDLVWWSESDLSFILTTVESQMQARGYVRVELDGCEALDCVPDSVDFFMMVGAVKNDNIVVGGGWGCYPYWGYGGCWYYPYCCTYAYSYETGTILTNLVKPTGDPSDPDAVNQVHWSAGIQGVLSTTGQSDESRVQSGIAQAFDQSPYLYYAPSAPSMTTVKGEVR